MKDKSFLEILTEKVEQRLRAEILSQEKSASSMASRPDLRQENLQIPLDKTSPEALPTWIQQIPLGRIEFQAPRESLLGKVYPLNRPRPLKAPQKPPTESRKCHSLNEKQSLSYVYFLNWKIGLRQDFTESELKRSFRLLAMKLHPDRNQGSSTHYLELKRHYETLSGVFKSS